MSPGSAASAIVGTESLRRPAVALLLEHHGPSTATLGTAMVVIATGAAPRPARHRRDAHQPDGERERQQRGEQ